MKPGITHMRLCQSWAPQNPSSLPFSCLLRRYQYPPFWEKRNSNTKHIRGWHFVRGSFGSVRLNPGNVQFEPSIKINKACPLNFPRGSLRLEGQGGKPTLRGGGGGRSWGCHLGICFWKYTNQLDHLLPKNRHCTIIYDRIFMYILSIDLECNNQGVL